MLKIINSQLGLTAQDRQDMMQYPRRRAFCSGFNWFSWCGRKSCRIVQTLVITAEESLGSLTVLVIRFPDEEWMLELGKVKGTRF